MRSLSVFSVLCPTGHSIVAVIILLSSLGKRSNHTRGASTTSQKIKNARGKKIENLLRNVFSRNFLRTFLYHSVQAWIIRILRGATHSLRRSFPDLSIERSSFSSSVAYSVAWGLSTYRVHFLTNNRYRALFTVSARTNPVANTQNMVIGMKERNFPRIHGRVIMGMNTTMVVITHEMIGIAYSRSASMIADDGLYPTRILELAPCTITIIVSIAIPNERMSEKFVRKFIVYPP